MNLKSLLASIGVKDGGFGLDIEKKYRILKRICMAFIVTLICVCLTLVYVYKKAYSPKVIKSRIDTYSHLLEQELYYEAQIIYGDSYQNYIRVDGISMLYTEWYDVNPWHWVFVVKYGVPNEVKLYMIGNQETQEVTGKMFTEVTEWDQFNCY